jgi:tetratricopeptide (TPR) repeat protein
MDKQRVMMRPILCFVLMLAMTWQNSLADTLEHWSKNTQLLPQYCKDRAKGSQSPEFSKWRNTFGDAYIHIHHYCKGVFAEQKAKMTLDKGERARWLMTVVSQMKYVSGSVNTGHVLYPELHTRWGWALSEQGQIAEAMQHYQLAIQAKRNYTLAYVRLSELYLDLNQPEEARKILESGLKAKPDSRALKKRLKKLDSSE